MLVKFSSLAGGVFIEVSDLDTYKDTDRCFRFENNTVTYAYYKDVVENSRPNWKPYPHGSDDFVLC